MTSQYRHRRSSNPSQNFATLEPGEIAVNTANRQLIVGDAASGTVGLPLPLLAMRIFDSRAIYAVNDFIIQAGSIWRARFATGPGSFDPVSWDSIAGLQGAFVFRSGDTMTGHLTLPVEPGPDQAIRRDYVDQLVTGATSTLATKTYVDQAILPLASVTYVNTQFSLSVLKTGSTMTGPLVLPGNPTAPNQAANKAYVDTFSVPPGAIMDFAMPDPPAGWIACDGQVVSRITFANLFAAIGTTWGAGDGSTTFTLPNFTTRYRRHRDNSPLYANTVGTYQSPCNLSHYHAVNINSGTVSADHQHYVSGTTNAADRSLDHLHTGVTQQTGTFTAGSVVGSSGGSYVHPGDTTSGAMDRSIDHLHTFGAWSGGISANHYHNINGASGTGSADSAYEARPYSATVLTCIKA